ncbi:NADP-dependent oxidoreductase [Catenulispora subtropica]|uniref:NADP-dependent oxidoreductase n=1 Tax=Catenulispora subtropica TaxID=450798 RepID=A0ABP5EFV8_9ACTN
MAATYTAVHPVRRPEGRPARDDFAFVTGTIPGLQDGQVLVENLLLSVDPYMREALEFEDWQEGFGMEGRTLGRVVASREPSLPVGAIVFHRHGWSTHAILGPRDTRRIVEPADGVPLSAYLGILGGTGLTAYVGLTRVAKLQPGEDLFVSAAAGAVGSAVGQIARVLGARRIVGSAGSAAKVDRLVQELGFDAAFDYHGGDLSKKLAEAAPDGVDVYFDNVGGDHLEAAIDGLREFGRIAWCGAIAQYDSLRTPPAAPRNLFDVVGKRIRLEGFLVRDHGDVRPEFEDFITPHLRSGAVRVDETVVDGFENIVDAFLGLLAGENTGKMLVRAGS